MRTDNAGSSPGTAGSHGDKAQHSRGSSRAAQGTEQSSGAAEQERQQAAEQQRKQHRKQGTEGRREGEDHTLRGRFFRHVRPCGPDVALVLGTCGSSNV